MFPRGRTGQSRARPCAALRTLDGLRRPRTESPTESDWRPQLTAILLRPGELSTLPRQVFVLLCLRSPLTIDAPFAPVSVAECRSITAFQLAGGLFADTPGKYSPEKWGKLGGQENWENWGKTGGQATTFRWGAMRPMTVSHRSLELISSMFSATWLSGHPGGPTPGPYTEGEKP